MSGPPPAEVVTAFGGGDPIRLPGGQGASWRAGDVVLKPVGHPAEARWVAAACAALAGLTARRGLGFRVPAPVRATTGDWLYDGWQAYRWLDGEPAPGRLDEVIEVGLAFHAAVARLPRPPYFSDSADLAGRPGTATTRRDPWAYGDRVAWEELPADGDPRTRELLAPLVAVRRPVDLPSQVVHGDLGGNVLFGAAGPPAVIDWSVYFRPVGWALAVAAVDAVTWSGVVPDACARWASRLPQWDQLLVRALIYRIATREACWRAGLPTDERNEHYAPVVEFVRDFAGAGVGGR